MRILLIEDEARLAQAIREYLEDAGFVVEWAADGASGLHLALGGSHDAVVLDLMLPEMDGREVLRRLREQRTTPVLILTARDSLPDKVGCFTGGADDYLTKPFALEELVVRVRALVRRSLGQASAVLEIEGLRIDTAARTVTREGAVVTLSPKEYALLELLALRRGQIVSRTTIYEHLWADDDGLWSNTVDVYVSTLRSKVGRELIVTRRGHGYIIP